MNIKKLVGIPLGSAVLFIGVLAAVFHITVYQPIEQLNEDLENMENIRQFGHITNAHQQFRSIRFDELDGYGNHVIATFEFNGMIIMLVPKENKDTKDIIFSLARDSQLSSVGGINIVNSLFVGRFVGKNYTLLENSHGDIAVIQTPHETPATNSIINRLYNVLNNKEIMSEHNMYFLRNGHSGHLAGFLPNILMENTGANYFLSAANNVSNVNQIMGVQFLAELPPLHELPEELRPTPEEPATQYEERITLNFNLRFNFITTDNEIYSFENISAEEYIIMIVNDTQYTFSLNMIVNREYLLHSLSSYLGNGDNVTFIIGNTEINGTVEIASMSQLYFKDIETHIELVEIPGIPDVSGPNEPTEHRHWLIQFFDWLGQLFLERI